jgi:hypothetical protein
MTMTHAAKVKGDLIPRRRFDRSFLILAILCVALMPSVFKGGAELPHPHSFFQFWLDPEAAFDHHHHHELDEWSTEHMHEWSEPHTGSMTHSNGLGTPGYQPGVDQPNADPDVPTISPESAPGGTVSFLIVIGIVAGAMAAPFLTTWKYAAWLPSMSTHLFAPEPPPPRIAARHRFMSM